MNTNEVARIAALVGEPARAAMLLELLDGRALTATELARAAGVQAPTASRHLAQLVEAGLVLVHASGRYRYHRLASAEVARVLEGVMQLAATARDQRSARRVVGPKEAALRRARSCYDHIAGRLGVAITDRLLALGAITFDGEHGHVESACRAQLLRLGLDLDDGMARARPTRVFCRPCLDWSERRFHLAGSLGAALLAHGLERGWLRRQAGTRVLEISASGHLALGEWLGNEAWQRVVDDAHDAPEARVAPPGARRASVAAH